MQKLVETDCLVIHHSDAEALINVVGKRVEQKSLVTRNLKDLHKAAFSLLDSEDGDARQVDPPDENLALFTLAAFHCADLELSKSMLVFLVSVPGASKRLYSLDVSQVLHLQPTRHEVSGAHKKVPVVCVRK